MSTLRSLGAMVDIPYLHRVEYITNSDGQVSLKVNHSVYVGKFNSLDDAKEVVKGILTKLGCNKPDERILTIPAVGDYIAPSYDWKNITGVVFSLQPNNVVRVTSGLNTRVTYTKNTYSSAAYKVSNTLFRPDDYILNDATWTDFASGDAITATAGQYVGFTKKFASSSGVDTFTITDVPTSTIIDTFTCTIS